LSDNPTISQSVPAMDSHPDALFEPLAPQPAYRRVSTAIEQKILRRSLRPGDPLPTETELARQFAVNRSTVREALRQLESAGLVGRPGGGKRLVVTRPAQSETASRLRRALALDEVTFIELWEAMLAIAPRTAALAAQHPVSDDLGPLAQTIGSVESARNSEAAVSAVSEFFARLATLSGNKVLMLAMEPVTGLLAPSLRRMIDRVPQGRSRILVAQRCILEAISQRKPDEAEAWMRRHVEDFRRGYELAGIALDTRVALR
jgi:GntR family transcriptional repressor for pyruvate dehydrogenase complex